MVNTWYLVLILEKELRYMIKAKKKIKMFEFLYIFYNLISGRYYKISWMDGMSVWRPSMHLVLMRVLVVFLYF